VTILDDSVNQFIELPIGLTASFKSVRDRVGGPGNSLKKKIGRRQMSEVIARHFEAFRTELERPTP
jgi:hypothetical protein